MIGPEPDGFWKISANRLNIGLACPYKLYLYLSGIKEESDLSYALLGNAVHDYLEDCILHDGNPRSTAMDYALRRRVPLQNNKISEKFDLCVNNCPKFTSMKGECEKTYIKEFMTPKGRKVRLEARIDLETYNSTVSQSPNAVIDWKTSSDLDKDAYTVQMHVYRFATDFKYPAVLVSLVDGKTREINNTNPNYVPALCDEYIDRMENYMMFRCSVNNRDKDEPCKWCGYKKYYCEGF